MQVHTTTAARPAPLSADEALTQHRRDSWFSRPESRDYDQGFLRGFRYAIEAPRAGRHLTVAVCKVADLAEPVDVHFEFVPAEPGYAADAEIEAVYLRGVDIFMVLGEERVGLLVTDILAQREEAQPVRRYA